MLSNMDWPETTQCDVSDPTGLLQFRECLRLCKPTLASDDVNSIEQQLIELAWQDLIYRSFNEGLRLNAKQPVPHPVPNSLVELIHDRYFWSQVVLLRRLFEKPAVRSERDVFSLPTVLAHVKQYQAVITRQNYVCYDGTLYDPQNVQHSWKSQLVSSGRHSVFDTMTDLKHGGRSRSDRISTRIIPSIERFAHVPERLEYYANKYAAHASDPRNRAAPGLEPELLSLRHLESLHQTAVWFALSLGKLSDQLVLSEVPVPQFDQFVGWGESLFSATVVSRLHAYWKKRVQLIRSWSERYWNTSKFYISPNRARRKAARN